MLQARLTGAIKAIQILYERAPAIAKRIWGRWAVHASPNELSEEARGWIEGVVAELLEVERDNQYHVGPLQALIRARRPMLKATAHDRQIKREVKR